MTDLLHDYSIASVAQEMAYVVNRGLYGKGRRRKRSGPVHREPEPLPREAREAIEEYRETLVGG
jgi:hypothetical protein